MFKLIQSLSVHQTCIIFLKVGISKPDMVHHAGCLMFPVAAEPQNYQSLSSNTLLVVLTVFVHTF